MLRALDVCFKAFYVFELEFPIDSRHIWLIIQRSIYQIVTSRDHVSSNIAFILNELKNVLSTKETEESDTENKEDVNEKDKDRKSGTDSEEDDKS